MYNVLVVDDDEPIRSMLTRILRREGYTITTAANGLEAIDRLREAEYGAVILDMMMPYKNGSDVLEVMRIERPQQIARTIIASAADAKKLAEKEPDICDIVSKPFDIRHLTGLVAKCIKKAQTVNTPELEGQYGPSNN